jgi:hypothetical protein
MRLEKLTEAQEDHWRAELGRKTWAFGALMLDLTLPEFADGTPKLESMHFGYYLQPLHLGAFDRENLPRKLLWNLAHRRPPLDFLELLGGGVRIPHAFPPGFTIDSVLRIVLLELSRIPLYEESGAAAFEGERSDE